jgi:hypothetical protein
MTVKEYDWTVGQRQISHYSLIILNQSLNKMATSLIQEIFFNYRPDIIQPACTLFICTGHYHVIGLAVKVCVAA